MTLFNEVPLLVEKVPGRHLRQRVPTREWRGRELHSRDLEAHSRHGGEGEPLEAQGLDLGEGRVPDLDQFNGLLHRKEGMF